jgi:hypothetical protein
VVRWIDRWAARAQRESDERVAQWQERQRERARSGWFSARPTSFTFARMTIPPIKTHVRLPSEIAAYHAAARLVSRFQDDGPAAL